MVGYEALVRVEGAPSWGSQGTLGHRGIFLFADSVSPDYGAQVRERENKLVGGREASGSTYSVPNFYPRCEVSWQPRPDDLLPFMLAHFQIGTGKAGGTYEFWRVDRNLTFTTQGSNWGTNPYSINLDVYFGGAIVGGGTGANGARFFNGIVDSLTFENRYGEDFRVTAQIKFLLGSRFNFPVGISSIPSGIGSFSEFETLVDYMGTVNVGDSNLDVDGISLTFNNSLGERSKIGQKNWNRFPLAAHWMSEGQIDLEFARDWEQIAEGTAHVGTFQWLTGGKGVEIIFHNFVYRQANPAITDGQSIVDISIPFRGYPTKVGGTSVLARVVTGSLYGTNLFNFFLLQA